MATNSRDVGELTLQLAAEIRLQRALRQLKQEELSAKSRVSTAAISRIERGQRAIDAEQIDRIARAFGMSAVQFVASAVEHAEERRRQGNVYLPDGSIDPVAGTTTATSDEHIAALRARRTRSSE